MSDRLAATLLRPGVVFGALALLLVLLVYVTPDPTPGAELALTTYSTEAWGARGVFEAADRLGWSPARRITPFRGTVESDAVYVVLDPPLPLTSGEVHTLLEAVRSGAGLLVVPASNTPLADSLRVRLSPAHYNGLHVTEDDDGIAARYDEELHHYVQRLAPWPADTTLFLVGHQTDGPNAAARPLVVGWPLGAGRVAVVADGRMFANDFVREEAGLLPIRLLEWLDPGRGAGRLVFAEYHHGFGRHPSIRRAVWRALTETPPGRALAQLLAAAFVLVLALGARPIAPAPPERIERRSPLEHVAALSSAYEQIGASRLAARRLVHGLRRRREPAGRRGDDADYLRAIAARHPSLAGDTELLLRALQRPLPPEELVRLGGAIDHIERTLTP